MTQLLPFRGIQDKKFQQDQALEQVLFIYLLFIYFYKPDWRGVFDRVGATSDGWHMTITIIVRR